MQLGKPNTRGVTIDCYNCGELGHLAHQCTKPKKDKYKNKYKGKKDDSSNKGEDEKKKNKPYNKKDGKKKDFHKEKEEWQGIHRR